MLPPARAGIIAKLWRGNFPVGVDVKGVCDQYGRSRRFWLLPDTQKPLFNALAIALGQPQTAMPAQRNSDQALFLHRPQTASHPKRADLPASTPNLEPLVLGLHRN